MQQLEAFIMLRRHRHDLDETVGRLLITLELLHIRCDAILLRLCALIYLIQIRSFKMDTEDLCTLISLFYDLSNIGDRFGQHLFALCDGRRKDAGHSFFRNVLHPVAQSFFLCVIGIKSISAMGMDVDESRNDTLVAVVLVCRSGTIRQDLLDLAFFHFHLRLKPLPQDPDSLALNNHFRSTSCSSPRTLFLLYSYFLRNPKKTISYSDIFSSCRQAAAQI